MKVAIISGASKQNDSVRGIGAHNSELFKAFEKNNDKDVDITEISQKDDLSKYDVVHFSVFRPFFISLPFFKPKNTKFVLTIHDLIMLVYPDHYPSGIKGWIRFQINKYLIKKNVDRIITITEASKKDICRFLRVSPEIVEVIYIAPKNIVKKLKSGSWKDETLEKFNLPEKFILFDHGVNYNKNIPTLIKACRLAKIQLAIVGKETENIGKLDLNHPELSHLKGVDFSDVLKLGYVSDEDLNKLFNLAFIYVQPSYYEGFGMPVLEAMTVGTPVISSKTQALVEVGGEACLYFDPNNINELSEKIKSFAVDNKLRDEYVKKGLIRVIMFSWEKAARETLKVYKEVCA